jgi:hypothetical protein
MRNRRALVASLIIVCGIGMGGATIAAPVRTPAAKGAVAPDPASAPVPPVSFLAWPEVPGWRAEPLAAPATLPHLAPRSFTTADGLTRVTVSLLVLAPALHAGTPTRPQCGLGGVTSYQTWLPRELGHWTPFGPAGGGCFSTGQLAPAKDPAFRVFGQVRCRRSNFVQVFDFRSRAPREQAAATWRAGFRTLVVKAKTAAPCFMPEEMVYVADREGPPFVAVPRDAATMDVAAQSLCGSAGCAFYRFRRLDDGCWRLVDCNVRAGR